MKCKFNQLLDWVFCSRVMRAVREKERYIVSTYAFKSIRWQHFGAKNTMNKTESHIPTILHLLMHFYLLNEWTWSNNNIILCLLFFVGFGVDKQREKNENKRIIQTLGLLCKILSDILINSLMSDPCRRLRLSTRN